MTVLLTAAIAIATINGVGLAAWLPLGRARGQQRENRKRQYQHTE